MDAAPAYEFRTTCVRPYVSDTIVADIARSIQGAARYVLQRFQRQSLLSPEFFQNIDPTVSEAEIDRFRALAAPWVQSCIVR
jgi:pyruvate formate lyase activating enzyme